MLAAVLTGGEDGREQCRSRVDAMLEQQTNSDSGLKVHKALLEAVYKLLGR